MYESKKKCFLAGVYFPNIKLDLVTSSYDFAKYTQSSPRLMKAKKGKIIV